MKLVRIAVCWITGATLLCALPVSAQNSLCDKCNAGGPNAPKECTYVKCAAPIDKSSSPVSDSGTKPVPDVMARCNRIPKPPECGGFERVHPQKLPPDGGRLERMDMEKMQRNSMGATSR